MTDPDDARVTEMLIDHRRRLVSFLEALPPEAWDRPSLCAKWRVREVVAHIVMPLRFSTLRFLAEMARSGGKFDAMADRVARRNGLAPPKELVRSLRDQELTIWKPPGGGLAAALTHDVIHGQDIAVALGADLPVPEEAMRVVLTTVSDSKSRKHFGVDLEGVQLCADDLDWSSGSGRVVAGSGRDLALMLCGRRLPAGHLEDFRPGG